MTVSKDQNTAILDDGTVIEFHVTKEDCRSCRLQITATRSPSCAPCSAYERGDFADGIWLEKE